MKAKVDCFLCDKQTVRHLTCDILLCNTCPLNNLHSLSSILKRWMSVILHIIQNAEAKLL